MRYARKMMIGSAAVAAAAIAGFYASRELALPEDEYAEARSAAILAVGVVVSGVLLICATGRYWFFRANRRRGLRHGHHR